MVNHNNLAILAVTIANVEAADSFYVCGNVGTPNYNGNYTAQGYQDGISKYTNGQKISIYRHNGFWYMGDLTSWPPVTHYRCVADCPKDGEQPPLMTFETNPMKGKDPPPTVQTAPCQ
jgi:hypothetical protein